MGPVVAAGWLVATLTGAAAGAATGGVVGALTQAGVSSEDAEVYAEALRRGGALVSACVEDKDADRLQAIMDCSAFGPLIGHPLIEQVGRNRSIPTRRLIRPNRSEKNANCIANYVVMLKPESGGTKMPRLSSGRVDGFSKRPLPIMQNLSAHLTEVTKNRRSVRPGAEPVQPSLLFGRKTFFATDAINVVTFMIHARLSQIDRWPLM